MKYLYNLGLVLYWLVWVPLALIKDVVQILYVPFDSQRCVGSYIQTIKNIHALADMNYRPQPTQQTPPLQQGFRTIGYCPAPPQNLQNPSNC